MIWERSDRIAIWALIISIISLCVSYIIALINFKLQFGENLLVDYINERNNYIHAYSFKRDKNLGPYVTQIAMWYKIRFRNNSNKPISIMDAFYKEDDSGLKKLPTPFFEKVEYLGNNRVKIKNQTNLSIRFDNDEVKEFYILLPYSITTHLGKILLYLMRGKDLIVDSQLEIVLFQEQYLEKIEEKMLEEMKKSSIGDFIHFENISIDNTDINRGLLYEENSKIFFKDSTNSASDGYIFQDGTTLQNLMNEVILKSDSLTYPMVQLPFEDYTLYFQTGSGQYFKCRFKATDLPFERFKYN